MMKYKTVCFTGHRKMTAGERKLAAERLEETVKSLISEGYCYFMTGGTPGFDTLAAQCVLFMKKQYPHIKLILVLPCKTQTGSFLTRENCTCKAYPPHFCDLLPANCFFRHAETEIFFCSMYGFLCFFKRLFSCIKQFNMLY